MPTISSSSAIRTSSDHFSLVLRTRHFLVAGTVSENVSIIKGRLPADVDVILGSDLVIALSGTVDAVKIPGHVIQRSAVARHVLEHLRAVRSSPSSTRSVELYRCALLTQNEGQLGVSLASSIHVDQQDGRAKCMCVICLLGRLLRMVLHSFSHLVSAFACRDRGGMLAITIH